MKFFKHIHCVFFAILFSVSGAVNAAMPESGWWWNASEGGRGYSIEIQDNQIYFAAYTYDGNRLPYWYYSFGKMSGDSTYVGRVFRVVDGPCFGCAQGNPQSLDVGPISLAFNGNNATLNILGVTTQITRFDFTSNFDNTSAPGACYGEWSGVDGNPSFPIYFGERIRFSTTLLGSNGTKYLSGSRTGSPSNIALCSFNPSSGKWSMILDSSTSYWKYFEFNFTGLNRMEGTVWIYEKGTTLSGSGSNWVAHRTASKAFVQGLGGPATVKRMLSPSELALKDKAMDIQAVQDKAFADVTRSNSPALPSQQDAATRLERMMR